MKLLVKIWHSKLDILQYIRTFNIYMSPINKHNETIETDPMFNLPEVQSFINN